MAEKTLNTRIQHKHDTQDNWEKALNFIPMAGEIIVYDADANYSIPRIKMGDGKKLINELLFATNIVEQPNWDEIDETSPAFIKNKPTKDDALLLAVETELIDPITDENGAIYTDLNGEILSL